MGSSNQRMKYHPTRTRADIDTNTSNINTSGYLDPSAKRRHKQLRQQLPPETKNPIIVGPEKYDMAGAQGKDFKTLVTNMFKNVKRRYKYNVS